METSLERAADAVARDYSEPVRNEERSRPGAVAHIPGMTPGSPVRNGLFAVAYLLALTAVAVVLVVVAVSYRPYRGC